MNNIINWADTAVQAAVISGACSIGAAIIAAICAAVIGAQISGRKKLQEKLEAACHDIAFLLAVERQHCTIHQDTSEKSLKLVVRRKVEESGFNWSGRFTPGRVRNVLHN